MANLPTLAKIVVEGVIKLAKMFTKQFKDAQADGADGGLQESESEDAKGGVATSAASVAIVLLLLSPGVLIGLLAVYLRSRCLEQEGCTVGGWLY